MLARFASEAFSRAMSWEPLGRSIEKIVKAKPEELNVPEVSVERSNDTLPQPEVVAADASNATRAADRMSLGRGADVMSEP
jgi:hypothetical protein